MKIIVDIREKALIKLMDAFKKDNEFTFDMEIETLDLGDISIRDDNGKELMLIERKEISDLASSIKDGRYKEQSYRLNGYSLPNHNIVYLIEGTMAGYNSKWTRVKASTLYVTQFCLNYFKGFSVIKTSCILETVEYICRMVDKLERTKSDDRVGFHDSDFKPKEKTYTEVVHKVKKNNITPENIGEIILSQIPGISKATSKAVLSQYGSLYQLLKAIENDKHCLDTLTYITKNGTERRVSKTCINNIVQYLLYQKSNVIKIKT